MRPSRSASKRARPTGYHVAPDRDPFAYRKIFAHIRECVEKLNLPPPPPDPVQPTGDSDDDGEAGPDAEPPFQSVIMSTGTHQDTASTFRLNCQP